MNILIDKIKHLLNVPNEVEATFKQINSTFGLGINLPLFYVAAVGSVILYLYLKRINTYDEKKVKIIVAGSITIILFLVL